MGGAKSGRLCPRLSRQDRPMAGWGSSTDVSVYYSELRMNTKHSVCCVLMFCMATRRRALRKIGVWDDSIYYHKIQGKCDRSNIFQIDF